MAQLIIVEGPAAGTTVSLHPDSTVVIGRSPECDIVLPSRAASRMHCCVVGKNGVFRAADFDSSNGTLVNGKPIQEVKLREGDVIEVAGTKLEFHETARAAKPAAGPGKKRRDPFIGRTIGGYTVAEKLRDGPLGPSYKARNKNTGAAAVVKILPPTMACKDDLARRFMRQAKTGAAFHHPNVVQTIAAGQEKGVYYIAVGYVGGRTVAEMLDEQGEGGVLPPGLTLDVMLQIGRALEYASEHDIVHRDIRPENIIVGDDGTAKLDNLWLAKHVEAAGAAPMLTSVGKTLGSLYYMAPEQIEDAGAVDCRADIYSLGATVYRALTGRVPCRGASLKDTLGKIRNQPPKPIREICPDIPMSVSKPVERALSKNPDDRQQDPKELVLELQLARKYQVK